MTEKWKSIVANRDVQNVIATGITNRITEKRVSIVALRDVQNVADALAAMTVRPERCATLTKSVRDLAILIRATRMGLLVKFAMNTDANVTGVPAPFGTL